MKNVLLVFALLSTPASWAIDEHRDATGDQTTPIKTINKFNRGLILANMNDVTDTKKIEHSALIALKRIKSH